MIAILTLLALVAFAANSLLCRAALNGNLIDPASFTTIRLVSGAFILLPLARLVAEAETSEEPQGGWRPGFALFAYAASFSLAYVSLTAGTGAIILFGSVQATMISAGIRSGEKLGLAQSVGFVAALGGLIYLVLPGISAPDPLGALLMCVSGIAWGAYSILGRGVSRPVSATAANFARAVVPAVILIVIAIPWIQARPAGVALAVLSGAVTSGMGYVLWYKALPKLTATQASGVQLTVPVIAALGGVVFLSERISLRLILATSLILGGVALVMARRQPKESGDSK
ncbi:MAG: DMT family transporter [Planctomycetales bacterium]